MNKKDSPLVSVIIPVYNVEKYIDECLESVLNQTYRNLEIILVDDSSPDKSGKKCDQWAQKDERVKVMHKAKNGGLFQARITGFEEMKGDYFITVDSDDRIDSDFVKNLLDKAISSNADIVVLDSFMMLHDNGDTEKQKFPLLYTQTKVLDGLVKNIVKSEEKFGWSVWGKMYKARLYLNPRKNLSSVDVNVSAGEDILFSFIFAHYAKKSAYLNDYAGYYYRQNSQSIMHDVQHEAFTRKIESVTTVMFYTQQFLSGVGMLSGLKNEISSFKDYLISDSVWAIKNEYNKINKELQRRNSELLGESGGLRQHNAELQQQITNLENSKAYKLGRAISKPYLMAKHLLSRISR